MDFKISGKCALVMGASTGLGEAIARAMVQEGVKVAICARNEGQLNKTASEIGASLAIPCDLNRPDAAKELIKITSEKLGKIDILVCNTGGPPKGDFAQITGEQWQLGFQGLWM